MPIIENFLDFPDKCSLGNFIPKNSFYENNILNSKDKKIFTENIEKITWLYSFKEENINIAPFEDDTRKYNEIELINVLLKQDKKENQIAEIILKGIPYPMLLVFEFNGKVKLFVSHIREHLSDSTKIILEDIISTNWIDLDNLDNIDKKLFESLKIENLSFSNFYKFYNDILGAVIIYNGSRTVNRDVAISTKLNP
ncbi:DUF4391 domain-containing protein, partial [Methanobrevibacter sp. OttesenSCG-928-K11]|nr:DUF4391 domain-containing protein [Methanobrevibacter sp. OttesenSCG-928-K11]